MLTRVICTICIVLAVIFYGLPGPGQGQSTSGDLMKMKLVSAQRTLEGLVTEDFEMIAVHAQKLHLLSRESGWNTIQTKQYLENSNDFRRAAEKLKTAAQQKNVDAAGLAYMQLTLTCIDCHKHVRRQRARN